MDIALIFSKPISPRIVKMFCQTFKQDYSDVKAIYMRDGIFSVRTDEYEDDKHCFDYAERNEFTPIYITIL